jgi:hypothetical protein
MPLYRVTHLKTDRTLDFESSDSWGAFYKAVAYWDIPWVDAPKELIVEMRADNWFAVHMFGMFWGLVVGIMLSCLLIIVLLGPERLPRILGGG